MIEIFKLNDIDNIAGKIIKNYAPKIYCFEGEMGSGKTTLIAALADKLKVTDHVSSPTYSLVNEYHYTEGKIYHLDLFRIKNIQELLDIGILDIIYSSQYCFIEWPQLAKPLLEEHYINIILTKTAENSRRIEISQSKIGG